MAIHEKKVFGLPYTRQSQYQKEDGGFDYAKILYALDGTDIRNYRITLPDGLSILIWTGQLSEDRRKYIYYGMQPDVMFVQLAATNLGGSRDAPDASDLADFILKVQPKVVLPIHQEKFSWDILEEVARQCNARFDAAEKDIRFLVPRCAVWYQLLRGAQMDFTEC